MCESIGHRPLWSRCPALSPNLNHNLLRQGTGTADHLTLLRLLFNVETMRGRKLKEMNGMTARLIIMIYCCTQVVFILHIVKLFFLTLVLE